MGDTLPTVTIETPAGPTRINATDYDATKHKLVEGSETPPAPASEPPAAPPVDGNGNRTDGPTVEEFVQAGYKAANYPPSGYASKSTPEQVAAAVAAQTPPPGVAGSGTEPPATVPPPPAVEPPAPNTPPPAPASEPPAPAASAPGTVTPPVTPPPPPPPVTAVAFVMPEKDKFYVVDKDGKKLSKQGHKTEAEAQEAAKAFNNPA